MPSLGDALRAGTCPASATDSIACFLARLHSTSPSRVPAAAEQDNRARTEAALFSWPFEGAWELLDVHKEANLVAAVGELHAVFDTHRQCNVHADLHAGAVSDASGEWIVTEPGCAHLGCPALDLGMFFAHLLLAAIDRGLQVPEDEGSPMDTPSWPPAKPATKSAVHAMLTSAWATYLLEIRRGDTGPPRSEEDDVALLQLACGFAGCELIRRVLGSGGSGAGGGTGDAPGAVDDATGAPPPERWLLRARKVVLALAKKLVLLRGKVQGTDSLLIMLDTEMLDACHAAVPFAVFADFGEC